jgi:hypothetical protein
MAEETKRRGRPPGTAKKDPKEGLKMDLTSTTYEPKKRGRKALPKDDVKVDIEDDILKISYNKPEEEKELHPGTIHRGLSKKSFSLGYKISAKYDLSLALAKLEDGLLEISIPIAEKAKPKTIKIK